MDGAEGFGKADEWGVSKGSGIAGAMLGGTGPAMDLGNIAGQALSWGGIGATVGSFIPGVGTLIGGAVGAGLGAIMGAIGGENIAKATDFVGEKMSQGLGFLGDKFEEMGTAFANSETGKKLLGLGANLSNSIKEGTAGLLGKVMPDIFSGESLKDPDYVKAINGNFLDFWGFALGKIGNKFGSNLGNFWNTSIAGPIGGFWNNMIKGVSDFSTGTGNWFKEIWDKIWGWLNNVFQFDKWKLPTLDEIGSGIVDFIWNTDPNSPGLINRGVSLFSNIFSGNMSGIFKDLNSIKDGIGRIFWNNEKTGILQKVLDSLGRAFGVNDLSNIIGSFFTKFFGMIQDWMFNITVNNPIASRFLDSKDQTRINSINNATSKEDAFSNLFNTKNITDTLGLSDINSVRRLLYSKGSSATDENNVIEQVVREFLTIKGYTLDSRSNSWSKNGSPSISNYGLTLDKVKNINDAVILPSRGNGITALNPHQDDVGIFTKTRGMIYAKNDAELIEMIGNIRNSNSGTTDDTVSVLIGLFRELIDVIEEKGIKNVPMISQTTISPYSPTNLMNSLITGV
jgi:hypothetical protein